MPFKVSECPLKQIQHPSRGIAMKGLMPEKYLTNWSACCTSCYQCYVLKCLNMELQEMKEEEAEAAEAEQKRSAGRGAGRGGSRGGRGRGRGRPPLSKED